MPIGKFSVTEPSRVGVAASATGAAAGATPGGSAGPRLHAEPAEQLERVAKPVGDALEDGADEAPAVVPEGQSLEDGPRVRVRMRRPLALEVREERQPLGSCRPPFG